MLNRWTYGWFGQPAPPLPPTSSYQAVHPDAFDPYGTPGGPELDQELPGSWPNSPSPHFDDRTRPIPSNPFARFQSSPSAIVRQNQPSPRMSRHARFEELQDPLTLPPETIPFAPKPSVSPTTLNRLRAQLSARSTRPVPTPLQNIPTRSRPTDDPSGPSWQDPSRLVRHPSNFPLDPHLAPRQINVGDLYGMESRDVIDEDAPWRVTGETRVEHENNDYPPELEVPADFTRQQTSTGPDDPLWSQLPSLPETVLLEGTLLVPPPTFTSLIEISKISRPHWIPYQAFLTTKTLRFLLRPSDPSSQAEPSENAASSVVLLSFEECSRLAKPRELKVREQVYSFVVENKYGDKMYFATESAREWLNWSSTIRECIDLANGRAPTTLENALDLAMNTSPAKDPTRIQFGGHLDNLRTIAAHLEQGKREPDSRQNDPASRPSSTRQSSPKRLRKPRQYEHSRNTDGPAGNHAQPSRDQGRRRAEGLYAEGEKRRDMVDETMTDEAQLARAKRRGKRRELAGPRLRKLIDVLHEQSDHLEQSRQVGAHQSQALAEFSQKLYSTRKTESEQIANVQQAMTTLKEARQAQDEVVFALATRSKSFSKNARRLLEDGGRHSSRPIDTAQTERLSGGGDLDLVDVPFWAREEMREHEKRGEEKRSEAREGGPPRESRSGSRSKLRRKDAGT